MLGEISTFYVRNCAEAGIELGEKHHYLLYAIADLKTMIGVMQKSPGN